MGRSYSSQKNCILYQTLPARPEIELATLPKRRECVTNCTGLLHVSSFSMSNGRIQKKKTDGDFFCLCFALNTGPLKNHLVVCLSVYQVFKGGRPCPSVKWLLMLMMLLKLPKQWLMNALDSVVTNTGIIFTQNRAFLWEAMATGESLPWADVCTTS